MQELVRFIVSELVDNKDAVKVEMDGDAVQITVAKDDMGKMIGRQGRTAKAIRTIVKAMGEREGRKYTVDILEI